MRVIATIDPCVDDQAEEIELPMTEISGKGKDHDPPLLRVHLVWQGRRGRLQECM